MPLLAIPRVAVDSQLAMSTRRLKPSSPTSAPSALKSCLLRCRAASNLTPRSPQHRQGAPSAQRDFPSWQPSLPSVELWASLCAVSLRCLQLNTCIGSARSSCAASMPHRCEQANSPTPTHPPTLGVRSNMRPKNLSHTLRAPVSRHNGIGPRRRRALSRARALPRAVTRLRHLASRPQPTAAGPE